MKINLPESRVQVRTRCLKPGGGGAIARAIDLFCKINFVCTPSMQKPLREFALMPLPISGFKTRRRAFCPLS